MNQKTLPTSRRKLRWISTTSSGPGTRATGFSIRHGRDIASVRPREKGKLARVDVIAASVWEAFRRSFQARGSRRPHGDGYRASAYNDRVKRFDISQVRALRCNDEDCSSLRSQLLLCFHAL